MSEKIRFIDLFGGIGGFRHGLEQTSDKYECVDYIEYDKYAVKSYNAIFQEQHEPRDVTQLSTKQIPRHDLLCAGFPCQAFSIAGNRQGTDEARGKLFREIVRIARAKEPEMLLLENVKGLLSQKMVRNGEAVEGTKGHAFRNVLSSLHELGYCLEWQVLNSKNWGVPQNRERVFIIGHLGGEPRRKVFPIRRENTENSGENGRKLKQVATGEDMAYTVDASYYKGTSPGDIGSGRRTQVLQNHRNIEIRNHGGISPTLNKKQGGGQLPMILNHQFRPESRSSIENGQSGGSGLLYNSEYSYASSSPHYAVEPCLTPGRLNKRQNGRRFKNNGEPMFTLTGQDIHGVMECWKPLQRKRTEKAKQIRKEYRQKHGEDYSPMSEYKFGIKDEEDVFHTVTAQPEKSHKLKKQKRIRKLTPRECWRLQGFPDQSFDKAQNAGISDTQLYKQAGNAVTVNVIKVLGEEIQDYFGETDK